QSIEWTPFDQPESIDQGTKRLEFTYGHHHQRIRQLYRGENGETTKTFAGNCEFVSIDGQQYVYTYLSSPAGLFGIHMKNPDGTSGLFYIHTDHLGSLHTITDENGSLLQELSFDPWGTRRDPNTWTAFTGTAPTPLFDRGFTGHEHLDGFQLINMNGRLYDPVVSRMLSPDNYVQSPDFSQSFNRYTYSQNNPLTLIDPTGEQHIVPRNHQPSGYNYSSFSYSYNNAGYRGSFTFNNTTFTGNLSFGGYTGVIQGGYTFNSFYNSQTFNGISEKRTVVNSFITQSAYLSFNGIGPEGESLNFQYEQSFHTDLSYSYSYPYGEGFIQQIRKEVNTLLDEAAGQGGSSWLDNLQTGLDVAGIADPTGLVDLGNALIYAGRGQWGNAGISALAIIPYIGDVGKAGRLGAKTLQLTSRARTAENGLELAGKFLKPGYTEIAPGVFRSSDQLRQFRMTDADILGLHGKIGPHFNYEILDIQGNFIKNYHVPLK
ncbi:MAG: RHS repeat-associated core domain-containing protein, partial [Bacteroidales bacterium]|nr:RHS repeat-associated core domain-containing protein [Bacteroidales bacterium]